MIKLFSMLFLLSYLYLGVGFSQSSSPEILSTAGETFQGTNIQLDWTLGELAITTIQNSDQLITQGFHQPNFIISAIDELPVRIGQIKVFPIPTDDWISANLDFNANQQVEIQLTNSLGQSIWIQKKEGKQWEERYSLAHLPIGVYFLKFMIGQNQSIQTFKIQKN